MKRTQADDPNLQPTETDLHAATGGLEIVHNDDGSVSLVGQPYVPRLPIDDGPIQLDTSWPFPTGPCNEPW